jgi:hypothetical protein
MCRTARLAFLKPKYDMTTFDEVLVKASSDFMDKAKKDGKPFFVWHNTTRMHAWTFLSPNTKRCRTTSQTMDLKKAVWRKWMTASALCLNISTISVNEQYHRYLHD